MATSTASRDLRPAAPTATRSEGAAPRAGPPAAATLGEPPTPAPGTPVAEGTDLNAVVLRWAQLGVGRFLPPPGVAGAGTGITVDAATHPGALADLLVATADVARDDPRLTWTVAAWLATHPALVDADALARALDPLDAALDAAAAAVAGRGAARDRGPDAACGAARDARITRRRVVGVLAAVAGALAPAVVRPGGPLHAAATPRPAWLPLLRRLPASAFFRLVDANPVLRHFAEADARADASAWGYWLDDVTDSRDAIRPLRWVLAHNPGLGAARAAAAA